MTKKPNYADTVNSYREGIKKIINNYERIARQAGHQQTLKAMLARKGELWQK